MAEARPAEAPVAGPRRRGGRFAAFEAAVWAAVAALGLVQFVVHHPGLFRGRVQAALRELRAHRAGPRRERFVTLGADAEHAPGGGGLGGGGKGGPPAGDPVSMEPIPRLVEGFAPDRAASGTTLKWLSFWDENRYEPEDFRGWANFAFRCASAPHGTPPMVSPPGQLRLLKHMRAGATSRCPGRLHRSLQRRPSAAATGAARARTDPAAGAHSPPAART